MRASAWLGVSIALWAASIVPAQASKRVALVIGNAAYTEISPLANPKNDAELVAQSLREVGFDVVTATDVDVRAMSRAVRDFGKALRSAGRDAVGLFYYAGHGIQASGANYLLPVSANIETEADLRLDALSASDVLAQMEAAGNALNIVILDACRNNPFQSRFRSATRGLARIEAPSGSLVAYAAAPGQVAADGDGGNGPYAAALARAIREPGLELLKVFRKVRVEVEEATGSTQTPWEEQSLKGDFFFVPRAPGAQADQTAVPAVDANALELAYWNAIKDIGSVAAFEEFLKQFPKGTFAGLARLKVDELNKKVAVAVVPNRESVSPAPSIEGAFTDPCDLQAGDPYDLDFKGEGVDWSLGDPNAMVEACQAAVARAPKTLRFRYQLARAYQMQYRYDEFFRTVLPAAEGGYVVAMAAVGNAYCYGYGVEIDKTKGLEWYRKAADAGHPGVLYSIATMYEKGNGVEADSLEAAKWFRKAIDVYTKLVNEGFAKATYQLGSWHAVGISGVLPKSEFRAVELYRKAAEAGDIWAAFSLASAYHFGNGVPKSNSDSQYWYGVHYQKIRAAAEKGVTAAMNQLSYAYYGGTGIAKDQAQGQYWRRRAVEMGDSNAMYSLGSDYQWGSNGLAKNATQAWEWYTRAAEVQGCATFTAFWAAKAPHPGSSLFSTPERSARCVMTYFRSVGYDVSDWIVGETRKIPDATRREMQKILRDAGFYSGAIDGAFGAGTVDALKAYAHSG